MNRLVGAFKWAFGKDGSSVTQYVILYMLFYYQEELVAWGVPDAVILVFMAIVLNLNNNALKAEIIKVLEKNKKLDGLVQFMKNGMGFDAAEKAIEEKVVKTEITSFPPPLKLPDPILPLK